MSLILTEITVIKNALLEFLVKTCNIIEIIFRTITRTESKGKSTFILYSGKISEQEIYHGLYAEQMV